ncbi:MAG: hypothetical protein EOM23_05660 [Candidatus Moranbacteria bacterium]|nr:hypothetical protein [Candidatus Moranbacteria bacterium]
MKKGIDSNKIRKIYLLISFSLLKYIKKKTKANPIIAIGLPINIPCMTASPPVKKLIVPPQAVHQDC